MHILSIISLFLKTAYKRPLGLQLCCRITFATLAISSASGCRLGFDVEETTIEEIHQAIKNRQLTCVELVEIYLQRIKAYNGPAVNYPEGILGPVEPIANSAGINALGTLNLRPQAREKWGFDERQARSLTDTVDDNPDMPDALESAARLDAEFRRTRKLSGPLHCVVVSVKDQYDTFDMRTTSGADADYADDRPPRDANFIKRMREAGAIILAKANMGEYASGFRSSFGGVVVNPYDTTRIPGGSSGGSATSVAANLVTVAIGEETGPSIRAPAQYANTIGLSPTQELVSRHGMFNQGLNTRTGPIARTVEDAARVLSVIAGFDPEDELTAFSIGRTPGQPYESFTKMPDLKGMRIGVLREYMDKEVFRSPIYASNIALIDKTIEDLRNLGATIVEAPAEGLITEYIRRYLPALQNAAWTKGFPVMFPVSADGTYSNDHTATLLDLRMDPSKVPGPITLRDLERASIVGESKYGFNRYLRERGDARIQSIADLIAHSRFFKDPYESDKLASLNRHNSAMHLDSSARMQWRFTVRQIIHQAMAELELDALVAPTGLVPPRKVNTPRDESYNGITNYGMWNLLGVHGFPVITVPAGFTQQVWDREFTSPDSVPTIVGPVAAQLPVGVDFIGLPFNEPVLLQIAAAYEKGTQHRKPPADYGALK